VNIGSVLPLGGDENVAPRLAVAYHFFNGFDTSTMKSARRCLNTRCIQAI
jgi:hypothetical protein